MAAGKKQASVRLEDLFFYFDAVQRDRLDAAGISRKSGEILALRERLVKLPDSAFEAAMRTLRALVDESRRLEPEGDGDDQARQTQAQALFEQTTRDGGSAAGGTSGGKISPV